MILFSKVSTPGVALALLMLTALAAQTPARVAQTSASFSLIALNPQPLPPRVEPDEDEFDRG